MSKVTIAIPARQEIYLQETVDDILGKATGDVEVIVVLDGYWPDKPLKDDHRLRVVHWERRGMRACINAASEVGTGEFFMKVDAHVSFAKGFDETLKKECDGDWVVVPRRFSLEPSDWSIRKNRPMIDYEFLHFPEWDENNHLGFHARYWKERTVDRKDNHEYDLDEQMCFQGSCWFTPMAHFKKLIYPMGKNSGYGTFIGEAQEVGLKTWLSGGRVMVNKKTWYAHLWKGQGYRDIFRERYGKRYSRIGFNERKSGNAWSTDFWFFDRWPERTRDIGWLVERFWPVPSWPEDRKQWKSLPISRKNTILA